MNMLAVRSGLAAGTRLWPLALLMSLALGAYQIKATHLDDRLYYWLQTALDREDWESRGMQLLRYRVAIEARPVAGIEDNLSGLAFDADRDVLWGVINSPEELVSLDREGNLLSRHTLSGFTDVEGVAYLGDDLLVVVEERSHALLVIPVPKDSAGAIDRSTGRGLTLGIDAGDNDGFEGLAYDRDGDRLFVVKEHSPMKLYEIRGLRQSVMGNFSLEVIDRQEWVDRSVMATDLSSVEYDPRTGHLVLLSDESKLLMELDGEGKLVGYRSLFSGFAGLKGSVPQGEGLTFDQHGDLYLVSEPNLFYRFRRE
ncbi:SdiA-regulated domain-containing protein [Pseudomonas sp. Marseille-QA0892]